MAAIVQPAGTAGLERSCGPSPADWIKAGASRPGLERMEARFAGRAFAPHRHDTYALGVTLGGVQSFRYRGARRMSRAGECFVLHPDELHDGRAGTEAGFHYRIAYVEPRLIRDALGGAAQPLPFVRRPVTGEAGLRRAILAALEDDGREPDDLSFDAAIVLLADALAAHDPSCHRAAAPAPCRRAVERARDCLDAAGARPVASRELERAAGLSRYTLARHFRALLGTSPHRYLVMRRLDRARGLIRAGASLAEAAAESGFADQSHFTRHFLRAYGLAPGRWRAMALAAAS